MIYLFEIITFKTEQILMKCRIIWVFADHIGVSGQKKVNMHFVMGLSIIVSN